jgi:hypothetical protein
VDRLAVGEQDDAHEALFTISVILRCSLTRPPIQLTHPVRLYGEAEPLLGSTFKLMQVRLGHCRTSVTGNVGCALDACVSIFAAAATALLVLGLSLGGAIPC